MTMRISVTSISTNIAVEKYDVVPVDEDSNITVYTRRIDNGSITHLIILQFSMMKKSYTI
jgi:hypothetical protein